MSRQVDIAPQDVRVIFNPRVETDWVRYLISSAQKSIDIATFHIQPDPNVGWPFLKEIEAALARGVKVRLLSSDFSGWNGDPMNFTGYFLDHLAGKYPDSLTYNLVGSTMTGWQTGDSSHVKEMVVDDEIVFITGRGHGSSYLNFVDVSYAFKGAAVEVAREAFEGLWSDYQFINPIRNAHTPYSPRVQGYWDRSGASNQLLSVSYEELNEFESLKTWRKVPAIVVTKLVKVASGPMDAGVVDVGGESFTLLSDGPCGDGPCAAATGASSVALERVQSFGVKVMQNRILPQVNDWRPAYGSPKRFSYSDREWFVRIGLLEDTIASVVSDKIRSATTRVKIVTMAVLFSHKVKEAIQAALRNGVFVEIISNGRVAHAKALPWFGFKVPAGYYQSLPDIQELLQFAESTPGKLKIHLFDGAVPNGEPHFSHTKLAVIDDTVYFGSHNLTTMSSIGQDEMQWEFEGSEFANQLDTVFESIKRQSPEMTLDMANAEMDKKWNRGMLKATGWLKFLY